ncbi:GYD domain-containing protein [Sinorhizobium fredii]|uniref:GYD domain-containing protein n=1 Tax=Rhizobium fredii TaxID=380 RepID=UPI0030A73E63
MAHYVLLADFTDQGVKAVKDTVKRAEAFRQMAEKSGVTVQALFWTLGQYDVVVVAEAPDDNTATALSLSVASLGNVRTQTLKAFDAEEMKKILAKMV